MGGRRAPSSAGPPPFEPAEAGCSVPTPRAEGFLDVHGEIGWEGWGLTPL